ncbi:MAG: PQQ-binding-like beta-propeller repeat protein [Verrucomicrobiales bacterium]
MNETFQAPEDEIFNPFPGLRPFRMDEEYLFFGREQQCQELLTRLLRRRFLAVLGSSGSGKSSLVRAGLLPTLYGGGLPGTGSHWSVAVMRPGGDPLGNLAEALLESELWDEFADDDDSLPDRLDLETTLQRSALGLREVAKLARLPKGHNLLVVVDQFEELFRFSRTGATEEQRDEADAFVSLLIEGARQQQFSIYVVVTMRSDFFGDCSAFESLAQVINDGDYLVPRLTRDQLKEAIEGPVKVGGGDMAPSLVQRLLNDAGDDPDQLPILQHALMRTWHFWREKGELGQITHKHYEIIGGMDEALSLHADEVMESLPSDRHRELARRMFKALTERAMDNRGIRRPHRLGSLCEITGGTEAEISTVVDAFRKPGVTFLMPGMEEELTAATVIDISHESFMRHWKRMGHWVDEEHKSASIYHRLLQSATLWKEGRADLYHDPDLQIAQQWRDQTQPNAAWAALYGGGFGDAMDFLERSHKAKALEDEVRETNRKRELAQAKELADVRTRSAKKARIFAFMLGLLAVLLGCAAVVAFVLLSFAITQSSEAKRERGKAEEARREADDANRKLSRTFSQSTYSLGLEAAEEGRYSEALAYIARTLEMNPSQTAAADRVYSILTQVSLPGLSMTIKDERELVAIAFSPDGKFLATGSRNDTVRVYNIDQGNSVAKFKFEKRVASVVFSADGRYLAAGSHDTKAAVFDLETKKRIGPKLDHAGEVHVVALNRNASLLATGASDGMVRVWEIPSGNLRYALSHDDGEDVLDVQFSPQGNVILSASKDGTARLWDADRGSQLYAFEHNASVHAARFNRQGTLLVTASEDGTARVWDVGSGRPESEPLRHDRAVRAVAFSPDSAFVLTGAEDDSARLWEVRTGAQVHRWGHREQVNDVAFSPDGKLAVTASDDKTARIWEVTSGREISGSPLIHSKEISKVEFSSDGRWLATMADDHVRIWYFEDQRQFPAVMGARGVQCGALSPDGAWVATGTVDGQVAVWDSITGEGLWAITGRRHEGAVVHISINHEGTHIVSSGEDGLVCVWDATSGALVGEPMIHKDRVNWAEFSPDSLSVATASNSNRIHRWRVADGKMLTELVQPGDCFTVTFDPTGKRILSAGDDGTARLFNNQGGEELSIFRHEGDVARAIISPDGRYAATASADFTGRILNAVTLEPVGQVLDHNNELKCIDISPDGRLVATGGADNRARIWSIPNGESQGRPLVHDGAVLWVDFSRNSSRILTCSEDGTARVWDTLEGAPASQKLQHGGPVTYGEFTPDGRRVLTVSSDGLARLWSVGPGGSNEFVPAEFTNFVQATGGVRLTDRNAIVPIDSDERQEIYRDVGAADNNDPYIAFAREFARKQLDRTADPAESGQQARRAYVRALIESDALKNMETALELEPENPLAFAKRAALRLDGSGGSGGASTSALPQSLADIQSAELLGSDNSEVLVNIGIAYLQLQLPEEALRVFDTALQLATGGTFRTVSKERFLSYVADAFQALASQASDAGDLSRAVDAMRSALLIYVRLNPSREPAEGSRWDMTRNRLFQWERERGGLEIPVQLISKKSEWNWQFDQSGDWASRTYDDRDWPAGPGVLGFSDEHIATKIFRNSSGNSRAPSRTSFYFRRSFMIDNPEQISSLRVSLLRDDGARVFLNGTEIVRDNLPDGEISDATFALHTVNLSDETRYWEFAVPVEPLVRGLNVIAVEVHQALPDSSDLGFDLELVGNVPSPVKYLQSSGLDSLESYLQSEGENLASYLIEEAFPSVRGE